MIYTITLNPSIDYIVQLEQLELGSVNRTSDTFKYPGGKGINVSRILARLKSPNIATGFIGGFTGQFIKNTLADEEITTKFIKIKDDSRINVKLKSQLETEINADGPKITSNEINDLIEYLEDHLSPNDIVILAGSIPKSMNPNFYQTIIKIIKDAQAEFIIDTTGKTLIDSLNKNPLLVKPNHHELGAIYNTELKNINDILPYGQKLIQDGAKYAIVSMADKGALLFTNTNIYFANPIKGTVKNSVGAGDSMIAGFTYGITTTKDELIAFKYGVACGTATAFNDDLANINDINNYLEKVTIEQIK